VERHRYGRRAAQHGELRVPEAAGPPPVAVLIHGGFWRSGYDLHLMDALVDDLVGRGWATWNLEYRRLGRRAGGGYPMTLDDVAAGIDLLAPLARGGRLDLRGVVAIGHSAGGQLAAWAATRPAPRVALCGVVAQAGVLDLGLAHAQDLGGGAVARLLGGRPGEVPERYAAASPAQRLPLGVPVLLTHGADDRTVPAALSTSIAAAARAAGDEVELVVVPGAAHMGHLDPGGALWQAVVAWLERLPRAPAAGPGGG
jgi:pimeloyl-ACP methyl ester carboxylesterase